MGSQGGFGCCQDDEHLEWQTGGDIHALIVCLDYEYSPGNELTGIRDGKVFESLCRQADVKDVKLMYDNVAKEDPDFPTKANVIRQLRTFGMKTKPEDFFVLFYAGHG